MRTLPTDVVRTIRRPVAERRLIALLVMPVRLGILGGLSQRGFVVHSVIQRYGME